MDINSMGIDELRLAVQELRRYPAEVQRLQAIVDRLPKTADGVPVVPGMRVWLHEHATTLGEDVLFVSAVQMIFIEGKPHWYCGGEMSSTREAAQAAEGE